MNKAIITSTKKMKNWWKKVIGKNYDPPEMTTGDFEKDNKVVLISIHPRHVENILNGTKKVEYRRKFGNHIKRMFIYSTSPVQKIVARADVEEIIEGDRYEVWHKTKEIGGITRAEYMEYFKYSRAKAIVLKNVIEFDSVTLEEMHINRPPQSYQFMETGWILQLVARMTQGSRRRI